MRAPLAILLGAVAGLLAATQPLADTDMWWHLATGRETLAHGIVRTDVFSWSVRGAPVPTDQWLGQVLMYVSYLAADWRGVAMLRVALVVVLVSCVALAATDRAARPFAAVAATMPALVMTRPVWVDRPELFGFAFFAALLLLLRRGRAGSWRALVAAVVLVGVWANVHGSFALGAVLVVMVCAEGAITDASRRRQYVACALATFAATLATPAGIGTWTAPGSHFLSPPRDIQEWNVVDVRTPLGVASVATLTLVIASVVLGRRLEPRELVILAPVAFLSLTAARQAPLLAIAAAPLFAERVSAAIARLLTAPAAERGGRAVVVAAAAAVTLIALGAVPTQPDERAYPVALLGSIPSGDGTLARYEWGGWLIWRGVPVFVDGRLVPYGGGVIDDYKRIVAAAPGWQDALKRRGVRTLLVVPSDPVAVRATELGWTVRAITRDSVVIVVR